MLEKELTLDALPPATSVKHNIKHKQVVTPMPQHRIVEAVQQQKKDKGLIEA